MKYQILIILIIGILTGACNQSEYDRQLADINTLVSGNPDSALASLDSIPYDELSTASRHRYDLLYIKARDKAYMSHTSDSLVLATIDYYSSAGPDSLYTEALYYGGRVYSDLGDYPTALRYFHNALDRLPEDTPFKLLRSSVLSQTGSMLSDLHLNEEAAPYVRQAIELDRHFNDSVNEVYDLQLLGYIYLHSDKYDLAEACFRQALARGFNLHPSHNAKSLMYLARAMSLTNRNDSALSIIRNVPDKVDGLVVNSALGYAADIYYKAGIYDSAYLYAHRLVNRDDPLNKQMGYRIILYPELRAFIAPDTLDCYYTDYRKSLIRFLDRSNSQLATIQQSLYNYTIHDRQRTVAEQTNARLKFWMFGFIILILVLAIILLYLKNQNQRHIIELRVALEYTKKLKQELDGAQSEDSVKKKVSTVILKQSEDNPLGPNASEQELRLYLRKQLYALAQQSDTGCSVPQAIFDSCAYKKLQNHIKSATPLVDGDVLWDELEETVLNISPDFKSRLNLLTVGRLTSHDLHTAILIKCGISPTHMATLLGRSKGAIVSRRDTLSKKIFDEKFSTKVIDSIIRLL